MSCNNRNTTKTNQNTFPETTATINDASILGSLAWMSLMSRHTLPRDSYHMCSRFQSIPAGYCWAGWTFMASQTTILDSALVSLRTTRRWLCFPALKIIIISCNHHSLWPNLTFLDWFWPCFERTPSPSCKAKPQARPSS